MRGLSQNNLLSYFGTIPNLEEMPPQDKISFLFELKILIKDILY